jgi:hypothetical protein
MYRAAVTTRTPVMDVPPPEFLRLVGLFTPAVLG